MSDDKLHDHLMRPATDEIFKSLTHERQRPVGSRPTERPTPQPQNNPPKNSETGENGKR